MAYEIDGEKYSAKELEGTDIKCLSDFMNKNKLKAGYFIYLDPDGIWQVTVLAKTNAAAKSLSSVGNRLQNFLNLEE